MKVFWRVSLVARAVMVSLFLGSVAAQADHEIPPCVDNPAQAERLNTCQAALDAMSKLTWISIREPPERIRKAVLKYADIARTYVSACFDHLSSAKPETVEFVGKVSGTLFRYRGGRTEPFCSGFRVTENLVATAAHCSEGIRDDDLVTFRLYGAPGVDVELDLASAVVAGDGSDDATDFMVVPMVGQPPGDMPSPPSATRFRAAPPSPICDSTTPVLIAGHSQIAWWLDAAGDLSRWYETVKIDRGTGCQLQPVPAPSAEHCLAYRCQTFYGMSGGAIYGYDYTTHERVVIGMHLRGGAAGDDRTCGQDDYFNIGIRLPTEILELSKGTGE